MDVKTVRGFSLRLEGLAQREPHVPALPDRSGARTAHRCWRTLRRRSSFARSRCRDRAALVVPQMPWAGVGKPSFQVFSAKERWFQRGVVIFLAAFSSKEVSKAGTAVPFCSAFMNSMTCQRNLPRSWRAKFDALEDMRCMYPSGRETSLGSVARFEGGSGFAGVARKVRFWCASGLAPPKAGASNMARSSESK